MMDKHSPAGTMMTFIRRHPAISYFCLAFLVSWGGVLSVVGGGSMPAPADEAAKRFLFVYLAMLAGPPVAGLTTTVLLSGRGGLRQFFDRLTRWRVEGRWYVVALLTAPVSLAATLVILGPWSADFRPGVLSGSATGPFAAMSPAAFLVFAPLVGLGAGFFEELGWTGFAIPTLRSRFSILTTGLTVGILWGAWHFLAVFWGSERAFGSASIPLFMVVALFSFLPPYRLLMVRVYERTDSLFIGILMHASLTANMILFGTPGSGYSAILYDLVFAGVLWLMVFGSSAWKSARPVQLATTHH